MRSAPALRRAVRRPLGARALGVAALAWAGCASGPPPAPPPPGWSAPLQAQADALEAHLRALPPVAGDALVVRLAFGPEADLDLYVTDPRLETVYFANTPLRTGGALEADVRCGEEAPASAGPRVETVRFDAPRRGTYRVGVDHPQACRGDVEVAAFVVSIEHRGERSTRRGLAPRRVFTPIVSEPSVR